MLYAIGLGLSKASIVFLYQRIFEGPRLRWVLLAAQVFNALLALSYVVTAFFTARPFGCSFVLDEPAGGCTYNDVWDGSGAYSAVNAAYDAWLVGIPAVVVWRLQMRTANKVGVIAVFAAGVLTCLVAIARAVIYSLNGNPGMSLLPLPMWAKFPRRAPGLISSFSTLRSLRLQLSAPHLGSLLRLLRRADLVLRHRLPPHRPTALRQEGLAGSQDGLQLAVIDVVVADAGRLFVVILGGREEYTFGVQAAMDHLGPALGELPASH